MEPVNQTSLTAAQVAPESGVQTHQPIQPQNPPKLHKARPPQTKKAISLTGQLSAMIKGIDKHSHDNRRPNIDEAAVLNDFSILNNLQANLISAHAQYKQAQGDLRVAAAQALAELHVFHLQMLTLYGKSSPIQVGLGFTTVQTQADQSLRRRKAAAKKAAQALAEPPVAEPAPVPPKPGHKHKAAPAHAKVGGNQHILKLRTQLEQIINNLPNYLGWPNFPGEYTVAWAQGLLAALDKALQEVALGSQFLSQTKQSLKQAHTNIEKDYRMWVLKLYAAYGRYSPVLSDYGVNPHKPTHPRKKPVAPPTPAR